jgi:hypothetical protein
MSNDLATLEVGPRTYRVTHGHYDFSIQLVAVEGGHEVWSVVIGLPQYFQADRATLTMRGADVVVALVAFHCKSDAGMDGTCVVDATGTIRSTSW